MREGLRFSCAALALTVVGYVACKDDDDDPGMMDAQATDSAPVPLYFCVPVPDASVDGGSPQCPDQPVPADDCPRGCMPQPIS